MGKPKQHIEVFKTILLVVLFLTTILLLYFWSNPVTGGFRLADIIGEEPEEIPTYEEVIQPGKDHRSFRGRRVHGPENGDFDAWDKCLQLLRV